MLFTTILEEERETRSFPGVVVAILPKAVATLQRPTMKFRTADKRPWQHGISAGLWPVTYYINMIINSE